MKPKRFSWLAIVVVIAALSGLASYGASATSAAVPVAALPTVNPGTGVNAAPVPALPFDRSETAKTAFLQWWNYEIQVPQDDKPIETVYEAGQVVCLARHQKAGPEAVLTSIERDWGFTKSGAAGIYKAAVVALCPQFNTGYQTYFDKNVDKFVVGVKQRLVFRQYVPGTMAFGYFMKETCAGMGAPGVGGTGIYSHMRSMTQLELMENGTVPDQVLYILINQAVTAGCFEVYTQLPPVIQLQR